MTQLPEVRTFPFLPSFITKTLEKGGVQSVLTILMGAGTCENERGCLKFHGKGAWQMTFNDTTIYCSST